MEYPGFIGASNVNASPFVDCERAENLYLEKQIDPATDAKRKLILRRRPGLSVPLQTLGATPGRGAFAIDGRCFAVAGGSFYELLTPTTSVLRGAVANDGNAVQFACNSTQILILAGGSGYVFTLATNTLQQITAAAFPANAVSCCSIDTYFLVLGANSNEFFMSNPLDGLTWSGLNFGSSQEPDNAVALANLHNYLWIFGQQETVLFQDSGNASFPFTRVSGSQIEMGCAAANSVAKLDNTLFWLGADANGAGVVYRADGLLPTRVSTHAVETAMLGYSTITDAVASTMQIAGHLFYCLHFPTANATWVLDVSTGAWNPWTFWNTSTGTSSAFLGRFHAYSFGQHLALDYSSGNVYQLTPAAATDNGAPIRWLRAAPHISDEEHWLFYSYIQIDMAVGGGLASGATPQVMIRWSDDGGETWSSYRQVSCGATGQYTTRAKLNRCGRSRNRVFEVSGTDAVPDLSLIAAYLGVSRGVN